MAGDGTRALPPMEQSMVQANGNGNHLPSTEYRDSIPEWDHEDVNLRDYLDMVLRHKWLIVVALCLSFVTTFIFTLTSPKLYRAKTSIEVLHKTKNITKFEDVTESDLGRKEFYQTQLALLQSQAMALRVIEKLDLANHPGVKKLLFAEKEPGPVARAKAGIKTAIKNSIKKVLALVHPSDGEPGTRHPVTHSGDLGGRQRSLLGFLQNNLRVSPNRDTMIITIGFISPDRRLAQELANAYADEFVRWSMDKNLEASSLAREFLMKQIDRAKINLEKAEEDLNRFAKDAGIVSLDSRLNNVYGQLEVLNSALAEAEADLVSKEALYKQAKRVGAAQLPQIMDSPAIAALKTEYANLESEYNDLSVTFHDAYPSVKAVKVRMQTIRDQISEEEKAILENLNTRYQAAVVKVDTLKSRMQMQKQKALDLNERTTQYKIMAREVETNKGIYQSLLQRTKEIESMVGVSSSNIHIVDRALLPLFPFKPNVKRNLLQAIVFGLVAGIGLAFLLEYFADRINSPDELSDRFQIPILGVAPLTKADDFPIEHTFTQDPRAPLSEALRTIRVSLQLSGTGKQSKSVLLTSTKPSEGKTTLAANLALTFAGSGEKVVVVDADMRKPRLHKVFSTKGLNDSPGLSSFLAGIESKGLICKNGVKNLHYIPAGPIPPNPVELLASSRFKKLMDVLNRQFDRVIIDGPPNQGFADTLVLSRNVGGVVLVSSIGETTREAVRHFKKSILNVQGTILGCIINKVNITKRYGYQSYYKYYSYYSYGSSSDGKQLES